MNAPLFAGVFDLPWWGIALVALGLTHVTIASVTIFLHRHQAHRALELHPLASHFFRFWLWLTTGMRTQEWAAVHRKHHARCETAEDPHSPQIYGINRVLWGGVLLYVKESNCADTLARYGHGTPNDWIEQKLYSRYVFMGIVLMAGIDLLLFGLLPGGVIFGVQMLWIPFWAAGVINGIGHYWGYRSWITGDASTNIVPWGILIGGEELHNNHHAHATSARLSSKWYEFDIGWLYIRILQALGLATVKHVAPVPRLGAVRPVADAQTLQAVIAYRHDVLASYARSLKQVCADELAVLRRAVSRETPHDTQWVRNLKGWLFRDAALLAAAERDALLRGLSRSPVLHKVHVMRDELAALWGRSMDNREQLVHKLQDWCQRAEASGIAPLAAFSRRLRSYA